MKALHILLTLRCLYECDHCFLFCGPENIEVFSREYLHEVLEDAKKLPDLDAVFLEGGEPFLYYPLLLSGVEKASSLDLQSGIVSNAYWATDFDDILLWLKPLKEAGLSSLSVSTGDFHEPSKSSSRDFSQNSQESYNALKELEKELNLDINFMETKAPEVDENGELESGGVMFKGRAAEKLTEDLPFKPPEEFDECPYEDLMTPDRVHVDPEGRVHICQGLLIGNHQRSSLKEVLLNYDHEKHPLISPLAAGGPAALAESVNYSAAEGYVDACHYCFVLRKYLLAEGKYREYLGPPSVYGAL